MGEGEAIGAIIVLIVVVYIILLVIFAVAYIGAAGGALWGSGTAFTNYAKSFKENMIDSN